MRAKVGPGSTSRELRRVSRLVRAALTAATATSLIAVGCGGSDDSSDELAQQTALEQARKEGAQTARQNARIRELERDLREAKKESSQPSSGGTVPSSGGTAPTSPTPSAPGSYVASYEAYSPSDPTYGYVAQVPVGGGWSAPTESHPTSGALLRTSWRGPDGTLLIIDRTPSEVPQLGGSYDAVGTVPQPAFGQATKYNFSQSTALPDCNGRPCVDYLINDGAGGGWGVLAGGPNLAVADSIASHVMQSVTYGE